MNSRLTYNGCVKSTDYTNRYNGGPHWKSGHCDKQETKTQELINLNKPMNFNGWAKLHVNTLATKVMHYSKSKRLNPNIWYKKHHFPVISSPYCALLRVYILCIDSYKTPQNVSHTKWIQRFMSSVIMDVEALWNSAGRDFKTSQR